MTIPLKDILKKLKTKKLIKLESVVNNPNKFRPVPLSIPEFIPLPPRDIVLRLKTVLLGYLNYYSFADDRPKLHLIYWLLKECLIKTLSRKLKMGRRAILNKFGSSITIDFSSNSNKSTKSIDFSCPDLSRKPMNFQISPIMDPTGPLGWKIRTTHHFGEPCVNCGSEFNIEMHHIKHIKTINPHLNEFDKKVAAINRKQIPLCHNCHKLVHTGQYKGISLKYYNKTLAPAIIL